MESNIILFIAYALVCVLLIRVVHGEKKVYVLLMTSIGFLCICDFRFLLIALIESILGFCFGALLGKRNQKVFLFCGLFGVVILWGLFRYWHFLSDFCKSLDKFDIIVPLGISYYSFKIIGYLVDVYKGQCESEKSLIKYMNYILFFPQIICGPIQRYQDFDNQLMEVIENNDVEADDNIQGMMLILSGLFKKIVIADRLSLYVNSVFGCPESYPALALWMAAFFYTIQIYCDFAGYSEIVMGLGKMMGVGCCENFKLPYFAYSIADFWRRWHISLSSWLRDYVYIPLGGNRQGIIRKYINVLLTFIVSGIWHGAGFAYIVWGIWHGMWNLVRIGKPKSYFDYQTKRLFTFIIVLFGWIPFKCADLSLTIRFVKSMFIGWSLSLDTIVASIMPFTNDYSCVPFFLMTLILLVGLYLSERKNFITENNNDDVNDVGQENLSKRSEWIIAFFYLFAVVLFGMIGQNSFVYANF